MKLALYEHLHRVACAQAVYTRQAIKKLSLLLVLGIIIIYQLTIYKLRYLV
jgi:hypothetical protein